MVEGVRLQKELPVEEVVALGRCRQPAGILERHVEIRHQHLLRRFRDCGIDGNPAFRVDRRLAETRKQLTVA